MRGSNSIAVGVVLSLGLLANAADRAEGQARPANMGDEQITIDLVAAEAGGPGGEAVLVSSNEGTEITVKVEGVAANTELAGYIISGACADDGEMIADLGPIAIGAAGDGELKADVPRALTSLVSAPVRVEVRSGGAAVACGEHAFGGSPDESGAGVDLDVAPVPADGSIPTPAPGPEPTL